MRNARVVLGVFAAAVLTACSSAVRQGPDPTPGVGIRLLLHASGEGDAQALADSMPLTALLKWKGNVTITARPTPPFITYDGDAGLVIEPTSGLEDEAIRASTQGDVLIRRSGIPGPLNAPGTIYRMAHPEPVAPPASTKPPGEPVVVAHPCSADDPTCRIEGTYVFARNK